VYLVIDYEARAPDGSSTIKRFKRYRIPESGKRYVIPNPYRPAQKLYISVEY
jgi:hypothetical protein